jgi:hypothetical protein
MTSNRRIAAAAAAAGLVALAVIPAASAAASTSTRVSSPSVLRPQAAIPADCTVLSIPASAEVKLTCTARPATQTWLFNAACFIKPGIYNLHNGNQVTGDGTSTITGCIGAVNYSFVVIT